jgi:hypothetical protein
LYKPMRQQDTQSALVVCSYPPSSLRSPGQLFCLSLERRISLPRQLLRT